MFHLESARRSRVARIVVAAAASVLISGTLAGVFALQTADAADNDVRNSDQCLTRSNSTTPDINIPDRSYLERFCWLNSSQQVYGGGNPGASADADYVGVINAGEKVVYCQINYSNQVDRATNNPWWALIKVDRADTTNWRGWGWVKVKEFAQASTRSAEQPLLGVPDCAPEQRAQWSTIDLPGADAALNPASPSYRSTSNNDNTNTGGTNNQGARCWQNGNVVDDPNTNAAGRWVGAQNGGRTDNSPNDDFLERHCTATTAGAEVYTQDPNEAGFPAKPGAFVGTLGAAGDKIVYCQTKRVSENAWYVLTKAENVGTQAVYDRVGGWGWVKSNNFREFANNASVAVPGVPDCTVAAQKRDASISATQAQAEAAGTDTDSPADVNDNSETPGNTDDNDCVETQETVEYTQEDNQVVNVNVWDCEVLSSTNQTLAPVKTFSGANVTSGTRVASLQAGTHPFICQVRGRSADQPPVEVENNEGETVTQTNEWWVRTSANTSRGGSRWVPVSYLAAHETDNAQVAGLPNCSDLENVATTTA